MSSSDRPQGWKRNVSIVLWLATLGFVLAWIWQGDWRWGATGGVAAVVAFVLFGLSFSDEGTSEPDIAKWN